METAALNGQGCKFGENLGADKIKISENLGGTAVAPVIPVDTSLMVISATKYLAQISPNIDRGLRL